MDYLGRICRGLYHVMMMTVVVLMVVIFKLSFRRTVYSDGRRNCIILGEDYNKTQQHTIIHGPSYPVDRGNSNTSHNI